MCRPGEDPEDSCSGALILNPTGRIERPGLRPALIALVSAVVLLSQVPRLGGAFTDGQSGNCGAMFALFARNEQALGGWMATRGLPVLDPVPPPSLEQAQVYTHHPPGLPWLIMAAARLPLPIETASRCVALALFLCTCLLAADLTARLAGQRTGLAAGLLCALLPAGLHDGLLVNYETAALPALLLLTRSLVAGTGSPWMAGLAAALTDFVALLPLAWGWLASPRRRWLVASLAGAATTIVLWLWTAAVAPGAPGAALGQALGASFLAPEFRWAAWLAAMGAHLTTLYGWALVPAVLSLLLIGRRSVLQRRALLWLVATGVLNVTLFARHAIGHEHFSLLLLPAVAIGTALLLAPSDEATSPSSAVGLLLLVVLLLLGLQQYRQEAPTRSLTKEAVLAAHFASATRLDVIYVRPEGASLVFLHSAQRHLSHRSVASLAEAQAAVAEYRVRFALPGLRGVIAWSPTHADLPRPTWLAGLPALSVAQGWLFFELPAP
ncbi:MAG: hypothetical protein ACT4PU_10850 [Planctomycetota bacterium]